MIEKFTRDELTTLAYETTVTGDRLIS